MKKRLLITSIVMMLVVAVALSTATYAWFTSNARVDATSMTLKASVSDGSSLGIGWLGGDAGTSIDSDLYDVLLPMAPADLEKGVTESEGLVFYNSTIREEESQFVFNGVSASYKKTTDENIVGGKTYYVADGENFKAVASPVVGNIANYYEKGTFAPIIYAKNGVEAFYVRNSSAANPIGTVTLTASFTATNTYILTKDANYRMGSKYYTFGAAEIEVGASSTGLFEKAGDNYSVTTDSTAQDGKTYYNVTEHSVVASNASGTQVVANAEIPANTYEAISGNDLIRVAIFTKPQSTGTNTDDEYTLLGVLGNAATGYTDITVASAEAYAALDKNTTYYKRTGASAPYTYTQVDFADAYDSGATYCTLANTAVYGGASSFGDNKAVRDLDHYTDVVTSMTLTTNLAPGKQVDIVAIAWLDGTLLDDAHASVLGQVSLYFTAA